MSDEYQLTDRMRELMGTLEPEGIRLRSALPLLGVLPPEEVVRLLRQRASVLSAENTAMRAALRRRARDAPRLSVVEAEYTLVMREAEAAWVQCLLRDLSSSSDTSL